MDVSCLSFVIVAMVMSGSSCRAKVIDLSHKHGPKTFMAGTSAHYNRTVFFFQDFAPGVFIDMANLYTGEHGGTHMDAPSHFVKGSTPVDEIPLENLILDGVMIDCSADVKGNADYVMPLQKLHDWEEEHGKIPEGAGVVVNFDWSSRFDKPEEYTSSRDVKDFSRLRYPTLSTESAQWLMASRKVKLLAIDTSSPDKPNFPVHQLVLTRKAVIVENVRDPGRLPARGFRLHAPPVAYLGASGTQIRLYAIPYNADGNKAGPRLRGFCGGSVFMLFFSCVVMYYHYYY